MAAQKYKLPKLLQFELHFISQRRSQVTGSESHYDVKYDPYGTQGTSIKLLSSVKSFVFSITVSYLTVPQLLQHYCSLTVVIYSFIHN